MTLPKGAGPAKRADAPSQPHVDRFATAISNARATEGTFSQSHSHRFCVSEPIKSFGVSRGALCIMAVDPGLTGAVSYYFPAQDTVTVDDMPVAGGDIDAATLAARVNQMKPDVAIVELVASRPGQGVASMFRFGCGYGMVRGVIAASGVPVHLITPARWKRHFRLPPDKEASRALALRLWPARSDLFGLKRHHGRAEASLLARYAAETMPLGSGS